MSTKGGPVFIFRLSVAADRPLAPPSVTPLVLLAHIDISPKL